mgnify:CR=1 FL=1
MSWQQEQADFMRAAECALTRGARQEMAELVAELMPWSLFINPATFDPLEISGALAGELRPTALYGAAATRLARLVRTGTLPPAVSDATALRRFRGWLNRYAREALGRPVEGLIALEHGGGYRQAHGHGLLWLSGGVRDGDIAALSRSWREFPGNGYIRFQVPVSMAAVVEYTAKHTVKALGDLALSIGCGCQWYDGLARPEQEPERAGAGLAGAEAIP